MILFETIYFKVALSQYVRIGSVEWGQMGMSENNEINPEVLNEQKQKISVTSELYEWVESIVFALAFVVVIFTFLLRPVGVEGISMMDTLKNGDKVVIYNINYVPKQGDIVVLSIPNSKELKAPIIKRVVAVGGQKVRIDYDNNKVYVDGKEFVAPIKEPMAPRVGSDFSPTELTVPDDCVFVMGDNRNNSFDRRYKAIGPVKVKNILGRAVFRILPFSGFGFLQ